MEFSLLCNDQMKTNYTFFWVFWAFEEFNVKVSSLNEQLESTIKQPFWKFTLEYFEIQMKATIWWFKTAIIYSSESLMRFATIRYFLLNKEL